MFFWNSCFSDDPVDVGNLISGSSAFSKSSLNIWKFMVHILLKPGLDYFEHYFASMWDECNCAVVWAFFGIAKEYLLFYSLSCVQLFTTPWIVARQPPLSLGFSRQEYWSGLWFPSPGDLPNAGTEPTSPELQADSLPLNHQGMQETRVRPLGWEDPLEKKIAINSNILAWRIPQTEKPGRLQSIGSQRIGHDWVTSLSLSLHFNIWHVSSLVSYFPLNYCDLK